MDISFDYSEKVYELLSVDERVFFAESDNFIVYFFDDFVVDDAVVDTDLRVVFVALDVHDDFVHKSCNVADVVFIEASRGEERRSYADTARDEGRLVVERNHVLVDGDVRLVKSLFNDLAGFAFVSEVDEHKVVVGAARNKVVTHFVEFVSHCSRVFNDLGHVDFEARVKRFFEANSLCSDDVHERAALHSRENS